MKRLITTITVMLTLFAVSCSVETSPVSSTSSTTQTSNGVLPSAEIFYDLPSAMASPVPSEATVTAKKSDDSTDANISLYDVYKPIPIYIHMANEAKNNIKNFIKELNKYEFKGNAEFEVDGQHVAVREKEDILAFGGTYKFFDIKITKDGKRVLYMNYFKNARDQYRGNFIYNNYNGSDSGTVAVVHYNGWNQGLYGKRMEVTFYKPVDLFGVHADDDPSVITVRFAKKDNKIIASGFSYHPTFTDDFFGDGPKMYAFRVVANNEKNVAIFKASILPADSIKNIKREDIFSKYTIDNVTLNLGTKIFKDSLETNENLAKLVYYSIEQNREISLTDTVELVKAIFYKPQRRVEDFTSEDLIKFIELNKNMVLQDEGLRMFYKFVTVKQPIFLQANATIVGNESDYGVHAGSSFGVESTELSDNSIVDVDFSVAPEYNPENDTTATWEEDK